jgi:hypothetical protein
VSPARRPLIATLLLGALAGVASAATITGTDRGDRLRGTKGADAIYGRAGGDLVEGGAGGDLLHGGPGRDTLVGGAGADRIAAALDAAGDGIRCGDGRDLVNAELDDVVAADCELVVRQLSRDPYDDEPSQHETQAEPDSFSFGSTVVAAFQVGRWVDGGAANTGWATSRDGGRTWRAGFLPGLSAVSGGRAERVSDPVVAYDAAHGWWLIASLGAGSQRELLVSRSRDGLTWSRPIVAAADRAEDYDKEWIACDNNAGSPFRGRCYLSYLDVTSRQLRTRRSSDGGATWSAPVLSGPPPRPNAILNGPQPIARPDGTVVVIYAAWGSFNDPAADHVGAIRSTDGGVTFGAPTRISPLREEALLGMRAPPLPSAEIDAGGRIFVAWHDCRFRDACATNDVVLSSSRDGVAWTSPLRVPTGPPTPRLDYFVPGLGVDAASSGAGTRLAVSFHSLRRPEGCLELCPWGVDVGVVVSLDGGATWGPPQRLNAESMPLHWIADTGLGRMLGDYVSTSWAGGRLVPVFVLAGEPVGREFRQAAFATSLEPSAAIVRRN